MPNPEPARIRKIALINFGGIGDEILFAPVIAEIHRHLPQAEMTLFLEDRSRAVVDLLPGLAGAETLEIQNRSRLQAFRDLVGRLRQGRFDAVISSGSNPLIPVMLAASGIPMRAGFRTGALSRLLLSAEGPLDRQAYAAEMYFSLARAFLSHVLGAGYEPASPVLPRLKSPPIEDLDWARQVLAVAGGKPRILIHPGVSLVSIRKNILKGWPASGWAALIRELSGQAHVFLAGGPDDEVAIQEILAELPADQPGFTSLYGQTRNLKQLAALIQTCEVLLCVDSSPMHIAVGYQRPLVVMFGPTDEKKLVPQDPRFAVVTRPDLACRPCLWNVRQTSCDKPICLDVPLHAMAAAARRLLPAATGG